MPEGFNGKDRELLIRLDERTQGIETRMDNFITKDTFYPVKLIAYGLAGGALLTILGGVLATILKV